jgi:acyl phosphate:glycerol-3-phosphate acyltransferase
MIIIDLIIIALIAYLLGSIPSGLFVSRWMGKVDITQHGSGNIGGTNVIRTVGFSAGLIVIICDLAKAIIAVLAAQWIMGDQVLMASGVPLDNKFAQILAGACCILGHSFSVYIKFHGGKSVAVYYGSLFIIYPLAVAAGAVILIPVLIVSRQMSRATLLSTIGIIVFFIVLTIWWFKLSPIYLIYSILGAIFIIIRHRENIIRLQSGTELKLDWDKIFGKFKKQDSR